MSSYYLDFEFHEGFHKPLFGVKRHFIDPISVAIVNDKGEEYYAVFNDFDIKAAWNSWQPKKVIVSGFAKNDYPEGFIWQKEYWLRDNVLLPLFNDLHNKFVSEDDYKGCVDMKFDLDNFKWLIKKYGKSRDTIKNEIIEFICPYETASYYAGLGFLHEGMAHYLKLNPPVFYTFYGSYDWVAFCSLFGKMIDLPNGFPMYTKDLKQIMDEKLTGNMIREGQSLDSRELVELRAMQTLDERITWLKNYSRVYPKQYEEHLSIADARWNKRLHEFLNTI